jgi:hypothetical protein
MSDLKAWAEKTHFSTALRDVVMDGVRLNDTMFMVCRPDQKTLPSARTVQVAIDTATELVQSLTRLRGIL